MLENTAGEIDSVRYITTKARDQLMAFRHAERVTAKYAFYNAKEE